MARLLLFTALLLTACSATGFKRHDGIGQGYRAVHLSGETYQVSYQGNGLMSADSVLHHWRRAARETCPDGFDVVDTDHTTQQAGDWTHHRYEGVIRCTAN